MREPGHTRAMAARGLRTTVLAGLLLAAAGPGVRPAAAGRAAGDEPALDRARARRELEGYVLRTVDGRTLALDSLRGEVVVLNFWATWCPPCRQELPRLAALQASLGTRGGRVVAVSIDEEARNVRRFARAERLTLPLYHDGPDRLARRLDLPHVPFTIVLDRTGEVAFATAGSDERAIEAVTQTALRLLAVATPPPSPVAGETR